MDNKITILITDDHPTTRAGIRSSLEQAVDFEIVGEAEDGNEAMELIAKLQPNVHLLDLRMPGMRAHEVEKWTRENYPETVTLVLTAHDRDFYLAEMMRAGVSGYLDKSERTESLLAAIRRAANGERLFTFQQYERVHQWDETAGSRWERLTTREREISKMLVQGLSDAALAQAFEIAPSTASCHVSNLLKKLGVSSRQEAVAWLVKHIPEISDEL